MFFERELNVYFLTVYSSHSRAHFVPNVAFITLRDLLCSKSFSFQLSKTGHVSFSFRSGNADEFGEFVYPHWFTMCASSQ